MQERARNHIPVVTRVKVLDTLLYYFYQAREALTAQGVVSFSPTTLFEETYVLIEESKMPHATKYRYKAFVREFAKILGLGNIRVRKQSFHKKVQKLSLEAAKEIKQRLDQARGRSYDNESYKIQNLYHNQRYEPGLSHAPTREQPAFEEEDVWSQGPEGGYENLAQYYDWEE